MSFSSACWCEFRMVSCWERGKPKRLGKMERKEKRERKNSKQQWKKQNYCFIFWVVCFLLHYETTCCHSGRLRRHLWWNRHVWARRTRSGTCASLLHLAPRSHCQQMIWWRRSLPFHEWQACQALLEYLPTFWTNLFREPCQQLDHTHIPTFANTRHTHTHTTHIAWPDGSTFRVSNLNHCLLVRENRTNQHLIHSNSLFRLRHPNLLSTQCSDCHTKFFVSTNRGTAQFVHRVCKTLRSKMLPMRFGSSCTLGWSYAKRVCVSGVRRTHPTACHEITALLLTPENVPEHRTWFGQKLQEQDENTWIMQMASIPHETTATSSQSTTKSRFLLNSFSKSFFVIPQTRSSSFSKTFNRVISRRFWMISPTCATSASYAWTILRWV